MFQFHSLRTQESYQITTFLPLGFDGTLGGIYSEESHSVTFRKKTRAKHQVQINLTHFLRLT